MVGRFLNKPKRDGARPALGATGDTAAFLGVSVVVGVLVGAAAAVLIWSTDAVSESLRNLDDGWGLGQYLFLITVPLGLWAAHSLSKRFAPDTIGDGVPEATAALALHSGYLPTRSLFFKIIVTVLSIGGGGSAGREGPIVQIGATIGSSIARYTRLTEDQVKSLVAAGAGAAVGAAFNAPIAGMLFAMEVILGNFATRHLSAVVIASVAAAVTTRSLVGAEAALRAPLYLLNDPRELFLYAILGLLVVPVAWAFLKLLDRAERTPEWIARRSWLRPITFGLVVAALGIVEPNILGTGQEFINEVLRAATGSSFVWYSLLAVMALKVVATSITLSSGGSGGAFFPSLFIGATLGASFALLVAPVWGFSDLKPGAFAVVGMAATFAAVGRAPLTAILIVFEVTGLEYGLVLPLMLTTILATAVVDRIHPESAYTMPLVRRGIRLVRTTEVDLLDTVSVRQVMAPARSVSPTFTLDEASAVFDQYRHHGLPVVDNDRLVGILTVTDIIRARAAPDKPTAREAMTTRPVTVTPETHVSVALERMAALGVGRLPVVANDNPTKLVGIFGRDGAVQAYHIGLASSTGQSLDRQRFRQRTDPGASFFDFRIPPGSVADGQQLRVVPWPEGCTLVSIRRGRAVMVPTGDTALMAGDVITAFGTTGGRSRVIERLNATADEPTAEIMLHDIAEFGLEEE